MQAVGRRRRQPGNPPPTVPDRPWAGGRAGRAEGGGVYKPDIEREGASMTRDLKRRAPPVRSRPGWAAPRVAASARADGGPLSTPLAAGMGGQGRMNFNFAPATAPTVAGATAAGPRRTERYGPALARPAHHPGMAKAAGGRAGFAKVGA